VEVAGVTTVRGDVLGRFQSRLVVADSVIPFALSAVLEEGVDGEQLAVENLTGTVIREAFLVSDGRIVPLGDLAAGSASSLDVRAIGSGGDRNTAVAFADAGRRAFWERESATIDRAGPVLVGWLDAPPLAARLGGAPAAASLCMVTLEVVER
jgi:hypothetical protein